LGFRRAAVNFILKSILNFVCKIDTSAVYEALSKIKPMFVVFNHVNFIDSPILVTQCYPLRLTGLAKAETWNNPIFGFIFSTYKAVSIDRNGAFSDSFQKVGKAIRNGNFVCIAPEGTRSKTGVLQQGKAGIVQLALETDTPIIPVAHYGSENIWKNIRKLNRTPVKFMAGKPFKIKFNGRPAKSEREEIISEIMGQIALLLPKEKRGMYARQAEQECKYLEFLL